METQDTTETRTQPARWPERLLRKIPMERFQNPPPIVNVLRLSGMIATSGMLKQHLCLDAIEDEIKEAFENEKVKCVALIVNSPGGSPVQSELIYKRIRALSEEKSIPVVTFVEDVAASGGYWLACAGDEIIVSEASVLGSIGVISSGFGFVEAIKKLGVERRVYTEGESKSILDPFKPEKESDITIVKNVQRDIHEMFKNLVRTRRAGKIQEEQEEILFSGEFWSGKKAIELGLADSIGDIYNVMRERYGKKVKLNPISAKKSWLQRKLKFGAYGHVSALVNAVLNALQERSQWGKFGF